MTDEPEVAASVNFLLSTGGFALAVFPAASLVNAGVFAGRFSGLPLITTSLVVAAPVGLEFASSGRHPYVIGRFVVSLAVVYFLTLFAQLALFAALGLVPSLALQLAFLAAAYVLAYYVVTRGIYDDVRNRLF